MELNLKKETTKYVIIPFPFKNILDHNVFKHLIYSIILGNGITLNDVYDDIIDWTDDLPIEEKEKECKTLTDMLSIHEAEDYHILQRILPKSLVNDIDQGYYIDEFLPRNGDTIMVMTLNLPPTTGQAALGIPYHP